MSEKSVVKNESDGTIGCDGQPNPPDQVEAEKLFLNEVKIAGSKSEPIKSMSLVEEKPVQKELSFFDRFRDVVANLFALTYFKIRHVANEIKFSGTVGYGNFSVAVEHSQPKTLPQKFPTRSWMHAFSDQLVESRKTTPLSFSPQCHFRVDKVICTGDLEGLYLCSILVGQKLQIPAVGEECFIPLSIFALGGVNDYRFDTCQPAFEISIYVINKSDRPKRFSMVLSGTAVL